MFNYFLAKIFIKVFAIICIILASVIGAKAQQNLNYHESVSEPQNEDNDISIPTVFGGVGRKLPAWQFGLDLILLANPHYRAYRSRLQLENRVFWGEWWKSDFWGFKVMLSDENFSMFESTISQDKSYSKHIGFLAKIQHPLSVDLKISGGMGFAKTEFAFGNQIKYGSSLVSEFRIGIELFPEIWTEVGFLTIDSSSGSGPDDQRLGSSSYLIGISYGL
tara:strand:- start:124 stop:783 length:660 start_codon:yes stop_codon:yes gene_type:complete